MKKYMSFNEVFKKDYLSWPKVGESVEFTIDGMTRIVGDAARKWGANGFDICLSGVDYGVVITDIEGRDLPVRSWEVYYAIKMIGEKLGTDNGKGIQLRICHIKDGSKKTDEKLYEVYALVDGVWKQLDQNKEWI